jgi:hypothetical protein
MRILSTTFREGSVIVRGADQQTADMFRYLSPEARVRRDHPLRTIRQMTDGVLKTLSPRFARRYSDRFAQRLSLNVLALNTRSQVGFVALIGPRAQSREPKVLLFQRPAKALGSKECLGTTAAALEHEGREGR